MTNFEMIKYHNQDYPGDMPLFTEEIAAHFDVQEICSQIELSLHTEYSYGKRKFNNSVIKSFPAIIDAQKDGIPQLWKNELWASQFADFIFTLIPQNTAPDIIEIHPPFNDYTDIDGFIAVYAGFEEKIKEKYPKVNILIENRCGSMYRGGKFIISKTRDLETLCDRIAQNNLSLKIAYDVPQIYTAHKAETVTDYTDFLEQAKAFREYIGGVHLWGKKLSESGRKVSHCGDLTSYFGNNTTKVEFLKAFKDCFDDGIARKMVLEVNSGNKDLKSIVCDLVSVGVQFV